MKHKSVLRQRRFEEIPRPSPESVVDLDSDHPAILQQTTLFPKSIVTDPTNERILISGANNKKLGRCVTKGAWKGFPIYHVTLTERATCPTSCHMYRSCYGNAMPFAKRHSPGPAFEKKLQQEVTELATKHLKGFVVRLHTLGDFYSVKYVNLWQGLLKKHKNLHVFGYTAVPNSTDKKLKPIAAALNQIRMTYHRTKRWSILTSTPTWRSTSNRAMVLSSMPTEAQLKVGTLCPAEADKTACCATCGLCWDSSRKGAIYFLKHGLGSRSNRALAEESSKVDEGGYRPIAPIDRLRPLAVKPATAPPEIIWVTPTQLFVEETYQRSLNQSSVRMIGKIVQGFDWRRLKPPIAVKDRDRMIVVDGQHTAIAAATNPHIERIPIVLIKARSQIERAQSFLGHNRDRLSITPLQMHYSALIAQDPIAMQIDEVARASGVVIPRNTPSSTAYKPGHTMAITSIRRGLTNQGREDVKLTLTCLARAGRTPIAAEEIDGILRAIQEQGRPTMKGLLTILRRMSYSECRSRAREMMDKLGMKRVEAFAAVYMRELATCAEE